MSRYPVIDWQRVALNIQRHTSLQAASRKIGRHNGFLSQIARGEMTTEPGFTDALRLLDMHLDLCGKEETKNIIR